MDIDRVEEAAKAAYQELHRGSTWDGDADERRRAKYRRVARVILTVADEDFGKREARYLARIEALVTAGDRMANAFAGLGGHDDEWRAVAASK